MIAQNGRLHRVGGGDGEKLDRLETSLGKGSLLSGDRMANGGWKMRMTKCGCQNVNDNIVNIGTRTNRFTMFSYILSCKSRPGAFIERNIFLRQS